MTSWRCVEAGRTHADTRWFRLRLALWSTLANRYDWPHRICHHYTPLNPRQEQTT